MFNMHNYINIVQKMNTDYKYWCRSLPSKMKIALKNKHFYYKNSSRFLNVEIEYIYNIKKLII